MREIQENDSQFSIRTLLGLVAMVAIVVAVAQGNALVLIALGLAVCWLVLFTLMGGWMNRYPPAPEDRPLD